MLKIIPFLIELAENNNKGWFDDHRDHYQEARVEVLDLVENILEQLSSVVPWSSTIKPASCLFRINRDIRFSKNKEPYKTHTGIFIAPGGRSSGNPGFYLHIEPSNSFIGGGVYAPDPNVLKAIRQEIYFHAAEFKQIILNDTFYQTFGDMMDERLKRPPKGFPVDFPDIEWLKYKHYVVSHTLDDSVLEFDKILETSVVTFEKMFPFIRFLSQAIQNSKEILP